MPLVTRPKKPSSLVLVPQLALTNSLEACWMFTEGAGTDTHDVTGRHPVALDLTALSWTKAGFMGGGIASAATASTTSWATPTWSAAIAGNFTIEAWINNAGSDAYGTLFIQSNTLGLFTSNSGGGYLVDFYSAGDHNSTSVLSHNTWYHIVVTYANPAMNFYIDAVRDGTASINNLSFTPSKIFNDNNSETLIGTVALMRVWTRTLRFDEIQSLYNDPFGMFGRSLVWRNKSYTTVYSFSAALGTFVEAGQTVALLPPRSITAALGTYVEAGKVAALKAGRITTAAVGTFTEAGQAAAFQVTRTFPAALGTFLLAGQNATIVNARSPLVASVGTFTESGQDAAFHAILTLSADVGSFALTGGDMGATLRRELMPITTGVTFRMLIGEV